MAYTIIYADHEGGKRDGKKTVTGEQAAFQAVRKLKAAGYNRVMMQLIG